MWRRKAVLLVILIMEGLPLTLGDTIEVNSDLHFPKNKLLSGQFHQLIKLPHDFSSFTVMARSCKKCFGDNFSAKAGTAVSVRRTTLDVIPGAVAAVQNHPGRFIPCPQFNHRMNPHIQMEHANIGPKVPNLLLTGAFYLFKVVEILLNCGPVGNRLKNLAGPGRKIATHKRPPVVPSLTDNQNQNGTSSRTIRGRKHLNLLSFLSPVEHCFDRRPSGIV